MAKPIDAAGAPAGYLAFRLPVEVRAAKLATFSQRAEIAWFGFEGAFAEPVVAEVAVRRLHAGLQGGAAFATATAILAPAAASRI